MAFFNDLFKSGSGGDVSFPKENGNGTIRIEGNKIKCNSPQQLENCEINIDDIQYVYILITYGRPTLFLFDHHQNWLPVNFKGFQNTYRQLSDRFGFDDQVFFANVFSKGDVKKQLWRKKEELNYQLIVNGNFNDYGVGYEVLSPEKEFVSWDLPAKDFCEKSFIYSEISPYGQQIYRLKYPVRIGNIILFELCAYENTGRKDVPVLYFFTSCFNEVTSDKSYFEIKSQLINDLPGNDCEVIYERADQNCFTAMADGMNLNLVYTYDSEYGFDGGDTSFTIKNERIYPLLLEDEKYSEIAEISDHLILNVKASGPSDYKDNDRIKRKFAKLKSISNYEPLIWRDDRHHKIGFADKNYFQVFDYDEIKQIQIRNILPAKGPGGGYLILNLNHENENHTIFTGSCNIFDSFKVQITQLTNKRVIIEADEYDC